MIGDGRRVSGPQSDWPATIGHVPRTIKTIDLFAGAGGLTAGFHTASSRFTPVVAVEMDMTAAATYKANHPTTTVVSRPIEQWIADGEIPIADVIVGGPPCQGFSALGRGDVNDVRNSLWEQYAKVITASRPRYFVVENVAQFLHSSQFNAFLRRTAEGGDLAEYDLTARGVLNAAQFGAAQVRRRTVILGRHRDAPKVELPDPTHTDPDSWVTVEDAFNGTAWSGRMYIESAVKAIDLPDRWLEFGGRPMKGAFKTSELHLTRTYSSMSQARIRRVPYGGNRFDIPSGLLPECWKRHTTGSADVMGRLVWDRPSVTIRTEFVKPEKGRYLHPDEHRAITLMEGARLQGFDDDYLWCGSKHQIARQIGNAVPIQLGATVARSILNALSS